MISTVTRRDRVMAIKYTNRTGKTYHLHEGKTKKGNPRYFFSVQQEGKGNAVEQIPNGYEIYEHPENSQVFLRKKLPQLIKDSEKQLIEQCTDKLKTSKRYRIDCKNEFITIYESNADVENIQNIFGGLLKNEPLPNGMTMNDLVNTMNQHYTPMMRFRLPRLLQKCKLNPKYSIKTAICLKRDNFQYE